MNKILNTMRFEIRSEDFGALISYIALHLFAGSIFVLIILALTVK